MSFPRTILIVDDEAGIRTAMANALGLRGHRTFTASGRAQAEAIVRQEAIETVLTDLRLEGGDGLQLIAALQAIRPRIRPIFMTGYGSLSSAIEAIRLGAVGYLSKPFRMEELMAAIEKVRPADDGGRPFCVELPWSREAEATPEAASALLLEAASLLRALGIEREASRGVLAAFGEALQNALEHAYPDRPGRIQASLHARGRRLFGRISDQGRGFDAPKVVAEALTRREPLSGGLRFLRRSVEDLQVTSAPGKGCVVEFRVERGPLPAPGRLRLPSIPMGPSWQEALARIRNSRQDLVLDVEDLEFLHPKAAENLRSAVEVLRARGRKATFEPCGLEKADPPGEETNLVRQALWA